MNPLFAPDGSGGAPPPVAAKPPVPPPPGPAAPPPATPASAPIPKAQQPSLASSGQPDAQPPDAAPTPSESAASALTAQLESLGSEFVTASEWGLFREATAGGAPDALQQRIVAALGTARVAATAGDVPGFQTAYLEAKAALNQAEQRRPVWYLGNNRFGLLPIVFTVVAAWIIYFVIFQGLLGYTTEEMLRSPLFLGFAGAILKSFYWLQYQINKGLLRPRWFAYFLVAPFIGVLLGGMSALAVKVGFKLLDTELRQIALDWRVIGLVSAFAGFNWEWALDKIRYGAEALAATIAHKNGTPAAGAAKPGAKDAGKGNAAAGKAP